MLAGRLIIAGHGHGVHDLTCLDIVARHGVLRVHGDGRAGLQRGDGRRAARSRVAGARRDLCRGDGVGEDDVIERLVAGVRYGDGVGDGLAERIAFGGVCALLDDRQVLVGADGLIGDGGFLSEGLGLFGDGLTVLVRLVADGSHSGDDGVRHGAVQNVFLGDGVGAERVGVGLADGELLLGYAHAGQLIGEADFAGNVAGVRDRNGVGHDIVELETLAVRIGGLDELERYDGRVDVMAVRTDGLRGVVPGHGRGVADRTGKDVVGGDDVLRVHGNRRAGGDGGDDGSVSVTGNGVARARRDDGGGVRYGDVRDFLGAHILHGDSERDLVAELIVALYIRGGLGRDDLVAGDLQCAEYGGNDIVRSERSGGELIAECVLTLADERLRAGDGEDRALALGEAVLTHGDRVVGQRRAVVDLRAVGGGERHMALRHGQRAGRRRDALVLPGVLDRYGEGVVAVLRVGHILHARSDDRGDLVAGGQRYALARGGGVVLAVIGHGVAAVGVLGAVVHPGIAVGGDRNSFGVLRDLELAGHIGYGVVRGYITAAGVLDDRIGGGVGRLADGGDAAGQGDGIEVIRRGEIGARISAARERRAVILTLIGACGDRDGLLADRERAVHDDEFNIREVGVRVLEVGGLNAELIGAGVRAGDRPRALLRLLHARAHIVERVIGNDGGIARNGVGFAVIFGAAGIFGDGHGDLAGRGGDVESAVRDDELHTREVRVGVRKIGCLDADRIGADIRAFDRPRLGLGRLDGGGHIVERVVRFDAPVAGDGVLLAVIHDARGVLGDGDRYGLGVLRDLECAVFNHKPHIGEVGVGVREVFGLNAELVGTGIRAFGRPRLGLGRLDGGNIVERAVGGHALIAGHGVLRAVILGRAGVFRHGDGDRLGERRNLEYAVHDDELHIGEVGVGVLEVRGFNAHGVGAGVRAGRRPGVGRGLLNALHAVECVVGSHGRVARDAVALAVVLGGAGLLGDRHGDRAAHGLDGQLAVCIGCGIVGGELGTVVLHGGSVDLIDLLADIRDGALARHGERDLVGGVAVHETFGCEGAVRQCRAVIGLARGGGGDGERNGVVDRDDIAAHGNLFGLRGGVGGNARRGIFRIERGRGGSRQRLADRHRAGVIVRDRHFGAVEVVVHGIGDDVALEVYLQHERAFARHGAGENIGRTLVEHIAVGRGRLILGGHGDLGVRGAGALGRIGQHAVIVEFHLVGGVAVRRPNGIEDILAEIVHARRAADVEFRLRCTRTAGPAGQRIARTREDGARERDAAVIEETRNGRILADPAVRLIGECEGVFLGAEHGIKHDIRVFDRQGAAGVILRRCAALNGRPAEEYLALGYRAGVGVHLGGRVRLVGIRIHHGRAVAKIIGHRIGALGENAAESGIGVDFFVDVHGTAAAVYPTQQGVAGIPNLLQESGIRTLLADGASLREGESPLFALRLDGDRHVDRDGRLFPLGVENEVACRHGASGKVIRRCGGCDRRRLYGVPALEHGLVGETVRTGRGGVVGCKGRFVHDRVRFGRTVVVERQRIRIAGVIEVDSRAALIDCDRGKAGDGFCAPGGVAAGIRRLGIHFVFHIVARNAAGSIGCAAAVRRFKHII